VPLLKKYFIKYINNKLDFLFPLCQEEKFFCFRNSVIWPANVLSFRPAYFTWKDPRNFDISGGKLTFGLKSILARPGLVGLLSVRANDDLKKFF